ncbi:hypothetical protein [Thiolapillus sp.]
MAELPEEAKSSPPASGEQGNWGKKLFYGTLVALLVFFYWLLIYSGGVTVDHG